MAIGGLGVSLAGFGGLIAAFGRGRGVLEPIQGWRIANVVLGGAILTLTGLSVVVVNLVVDDERTSIRIVSGLFVLFVLYRTSIALQRGLAWDGYEGRWRFYLILAVGLVAAATVNIFVGSVGFLAVVLLLFLLDTFGVFMNAVADFTLGAFERKDLDQNTGKQSAD